MVPAGNSNMLKDAKSARTLRQTAGETCKNKEQRVYTGHKLPVAVCEQSNRAFNKTYILIKEI